MTPNIQEYLSLSPAMTESECTVATANTVDLCVPESASFGVDSIMVLCGIKRQRRTRLVVINGNLNHT